MAISKGQRNEKLDFIRGTAILIVVFSHALQVNISNSSFLFNAIQTFHMVMMFLISGYAMGYSFPSSSPKYFIEKKVLRLLLPYVIWTYIRYFIITIVDSEYRTLSLGNIVKEVFISGFWFLRYLFLFFILACLANVVFNVIERRMKKRTHSTPTEINSLFVLLMSGMFGILLSRINIFKSSFSGWYYLWFVFGYAIFIVQPKILKASPTKPLMSFCAMHKYISLCSCFLLLAVWYLAGWRFSFANKVFGIGLLFLLIAFLFSAFDCFPKQVRNKVTEYGNNTLPIYAIHWCLLFSPIWRVGTGQPQ